MVVSHTDFPRRLAGLSERNPMSRIASILALALLIDGGLLYASDIVVTETDEQIEIRTPLLEAAIRKVGYVSGVAGGSFVDRQTGAHDLGFGLDIVDWIMEPGSDEAWRDQLPEEMVYQTGNLYHGDILKRSLEGPQICTRAMLVDPQVIEGPDFVAVTMSYDYQTAAPGYATGSTWTQWLVFPENTRYFISMDRVDSLNASPAMFQRIDMPGHIKHNSGDTFSEVYLSYMGVIPSSEFLTDFPPDDRFRYREIQTRATSPSASFAAITFAIPRRATTARGWRE